MRIAKLPGMVSYFETARSSVTAGKKLLKQVEKGKEYYLGCGRHAAIVRRTDNDELQYLELQTRKDNGWHKFNGNVRYTLSTRFGEVKGIDYTALMIDVDTLKNSVDLKKLLGYINTSESEQLKGAGGYAK